MPVPAGSALARGAVHPRTRPDRRPAGLRENARPAGRPVRPAHRLELSGAGPEAEQAFSGVTRNRNGVLLTSPACGEVDARNRRVLQLRDGGIVPLICPTCQMLSRSLKASAPATPSYFARGCFRYFSWERGGSGETLTACSGLAPPSQPSCASGRRGAAAQVARLSSHVIGPPTSRPSSRARPRCRHRRPPAGRPACRFAPRPGGPAPRPCH
jgi:hypothetical protein